MYPRLFGLPLYSLLNTAGIAAAALCAAVLIFFEWRRRRRTAPSILPPDAKRRYNPLYYLTREMRGKFNPVTYLLCCAAVYLLLQPSVYLTGLLLNVTSIAGRLTVLPGGVAFASGVLLVIPAFLLLARLFPGNGRPTAQLELVMPAMALNHVFNRMACFMSGCCFGVPSRFGVVYPNASMASLVYGPGTRVFPNQLLEFISMLLCFLLILFLRFRGKRTLPIFPLVFGAVGFLLGFGMNHSAERLKPIFGFTYPTPFTHLLVFFIGLVFLFLLILENRKAAKTPRRFPQESLAPLKGGS